MTAGTFSPAPHPFLYFSVFIQRRCTDTMYRPRQHGLGYCVGFQPHAYDVSVRQQTASPAVDFSPPETPSSLFSCTLRLLSSPYPAQKPSVLQSFRHIALEYPLGKPFYDGSLSTPVHQSAQSCSWSFWTVFGSPSYFSIASMTGSASPSPPCPPVLPNLASASYVPSGFFDVILWLL